MTRRTPRSGCTAKGPASRGEDFLSPCDGKWSLRAMRSGPLCDLGCAPALPTSGLGVSALSTTLGFTANRSFLSRFLGQEFGPKTGYNEEENRKNQAPIQSASPPQMRSLGSGERTRAEPQGLWRLGWIFVASGSEQVKNEEFQAWAAKHQSPTVVLSSRPGPDLCAARPLRLRQTKSSRQCTPGGRAVAQPPPPGELAVHPSLGLVLAPRAHSEARTVGGWCLTGPFQTADSLELSLAEATAHASSEALAGAAGPEENEGPELGL